jgi:hypothetical protein
MDTSALESKIRSEPLKSVGLAVGAGWLLTRLPVFALVGLAIRVALRLVRPALLVLGGMKAWDLYQSRRPRSVLPESEGPL